jgi:hypothetical protein
VCATVEIYCEESNGRFFIFTGFPVKTAIVAKISGSDGSEIFPDMNFGEKDGFHIIFNNVEKESVIKFTYQAQ